MKQMTILIALGILFLGTLFPARAQFTGPQATSKLDTNTGSTYGLVTLYPVAFFDTGGFYSAGNAGTRTLGGGLIALDVGKVDKSRNARYEVGGWYWGRTGSDLYEFHVRAVTRSGLGIQVGYLNTTQGFILRTGETNGLSTDFNAFDMFVLYEVPSRNRANSKWKALTIQFGGGLFIDDTTHLIGPNLQTESTNALVNLTFFVAGSLALSPKISLNMSDWVIRDGGIDLNRIALGVGYRF